MGDKIVNDEITLESSNSSEKRICVHAFQIAAVIESNPSTLIKLNGGHNIYVRNSYDDVQRKKHEAMGLKSKDSKPGMK